jgi:hypothetical protein
MRQVTAFRICPQPVLTHNSGCIAALGATLVTLPKTAELCVKATRGMAAQPPFAASRHKSA